MSKPVIGIIAKHAKEESIRLNTFIRDEVEQAIFDNGGVAIGILPPNEDKISAGNDWQNNLTTEEKHNFYEQIALCDGIILQGGDYLDEYECFIAKHCYDYNIPILGICAGKHILVRALGGEVKRVGDESHYSQDTYVHSINIDKDSKFYKMVGVPSLMVNSRHKNMTVKTPLDVVAVAPDGVIEVEEDKSKLFYLGVQFHPESLYKKDEVINNIFINFIDACQKYQDMKTTKEN